MPVGRGKYDDECTAARESADAKTALLLIIEGRHGSGFSVQTSHPEAIYSIPTLLRSMADDIEKTLREAHS